MNCRRCGIPQTRYRAAHYCRACYAPVEALRYLATRAVKRAIKQGLLLHSKQCTCVDCGKPAFDYDHRDYSRPLDVEPVCRSCNLKRGPAVQLLPAEPDCRLAPRRRAA